MDNQFSSSSAVNSSLDADDEIGDYTGRQDVKPAIVDQAKEKAHAVIGETQQKAGELLERTRDQVKAQLDSQKEKATGSLASFADVLHQTGQSLSDQQQGPFGDFAHSAASQVERVSDYLQSRDVDDLVSEVEGFARRQPALFLGAAFLLGLATARFLKSSSSEVVPQGSSIPVSRSLVPASQRQTGATISYHETGRSILAEPGSSSSGMSTEESHTAHNYVPGVGVSDKGESGATSAAADSASAFSGSGGAEARSDNVV